MNDDEFLTKIAKVWIELRGDSEGIAWRWRKPQAKVEHFELFNSEIGIREIPSNLYCGCGGLIEPRLVGDEWYNMCVECNKMYEDEDETRNALV